CLYQGRLRRNGEEFSTDPCNLCTCRNGSVSCDTVACPGVTCDNPFTREGQCCPECNLDCDYEGVTYADGSSFQPDFNPCLKCTCTNHIVRCRTTRCPQMNPPCRSPVRRPGECCATVCLTCEDDGVVYQDGDSWPSHNSPCERCTCQAGKVECRPSQTCPLSCTHGLVRDGQCCSECTDCLLDGRVIPDGQVLTLSGGDSCRQCLCEGGSAKCRAMRAQCPPVPCRSPVTPPGECCPVCTTCEHQGREYREGQTVLLLKDGCRKCTCQVSIHIFANQVCILHTAIMARSTGRERPCCYSKMRGRMSTCQRGRLNCAAMTESDCPAALCSHPGQRRNQCCPTCTACTYKRRMVRNGQRFTEPDDKCRKCQCTDGSVTCQRVSCPETKCPDPVTLPGECCPVCASVCLFEGQTYSEGESFQSPKAQCHTCTCEVSAVSCSPTPCESPRCMHPARRPGECCPSCDFCDFDRRTFRNQQRFVHPQDMCQQCACEFGTVTCNQTACPALSCDRPMPMSGSCCPVCPKQCNIRGLRYDDGEVFKSPLDMCVDCICRQGSITCQEQECASARQCRHPVQLPGQCCPSCSGCLYQGSEYGNGEVFASPATDCITCQCAYGNVRCRQKECPEVECSNPVQGECCLECTGCSYIGRSYQNGARFPHATDLCQTCYCQNGNVRCAAVECALETVCSHPVTPPGECCPLCGLDCQYEGKTIRNGDRFDKDCETCVCSKGDIKCAPVVCPDAPCSHPGYNGCCLVCTSCLAEGNSYREGQTFPDPRIPCNKCQCQRGSVICSTVDCPQPTCLQPIRLENECCPSCPSCTFFGILYDDGASWVKEDSPCTECTCNSGLVTCLAKDCFAPCSDPVTPPGQCCPECPTCNFNGVLYGDGQAFSPNGDPCDVCVCQDGRLRCEHNNCPGVASCPQDSLRQADPGACCSTCIQEFTTGCSIEELGKISRPRADDPCFICECKEDFMWLCQLEECPALSCPPDVQILIQGQCCPRCPPCFDVSDASFHLEGDQWSAKEDPCLVCSCLLGQIQCEMKQCEPIRCRDWEQAVVPDGQCCQTCQPMALSDASCSFQGKSFQAGDEWASDECTSCRCMGGQVSCRVRQCPQLRCRRDETLVTTPGQCCPVCKKEPGTCLVFGDPHYRTFDGVTLHFQGTCRYIMAKDCQNDLFSVEVQHDNRGVPGEVAWAQNLTVEVAGARVDLLQDLAVKVNGQKVDLPYLYEPHILVERSGQSLLLTTELGLRVLWDGHHYGEVTVPGSFKSKLCGLCGNFNSFPQDDLRIRSGSITNSHATFGNSWKVSVLGWKVSVLGWKVSVLGWKVSALGWKSAVFSRCHRVVPPGPFLDSCRYDLCACLDEQICLCDVIATYARECARAGVKVEWRTRDLCAFACDASKGLVFDECGPVCPRTCATVQASKLLQGYNSTTPTTGSDSVGDLYPGGQTCFKPCVAGCQCTADKVLHAGRCIAPRDCPLVDDITLV
ncbi:hypothetical protein EGW08_010326, partial [Elysia chlorotica]